jgi:hypothetical protein
MFTGNALRWTDRTRRCLAISHITAAMRFDGLNPAQSCDWVKRVGKDLGSLRGDRQ